MHRATEVVVSGCSAGGVASVLLADPLRAYLQARIRSRVFVAALSDSGIFLEADRRERKMAGVLQFPQMQWIFSQTNASGSAPADCLQSGLTWHCLSVDKALRHVRTPVFILQSLVDSWQVSTLRYRKSINSHATSMRQKVAAALRTPTLHAGVLDSCFHHCRDWGVLFWGPWSNADLFHKWYDLRFQECNVGLADASGVNSTWPLTQQAELLDGEVCRNQEA